MTAPRCAAGHASSEIDFCSVCGLPLGEQGPRLDPLPAPSASSRCPLCAEPSSAARCPLCLYPLGDLALAFEALTAPAPPRLILRVDPALDEEGDGRPPPAAAPRELRIERSSLVVGRLDTRAAQRADVEVDDPGASRQHLRLSLEADQRISVEELGSTNGTKLNGAPLSPGAKAQLAAGDTLTLGRWTRIDVQGPR